MSQGGATISDTLAYAGLTEAARTVARGLRAPALSPLHFALTAAAADVIAAGLAFWFAIGAAMADLVPALADTAVFAFACAGLVHLTGGYRMTALRHLPGGVARLVLAGVLAALCLSGIDRLANVAAALVLCALPARAFVRLIAGWAMDFGLTERRAVLIGGGPPAAQLISALVESPGNDIRICAVFDDRFDERSPPVVNGIPNLGNTRALIDFARAAEIDMAIVTLPLTAAMRIRTILRPLEVLPIDIRLSS